MPVFSQSHSSARTAEKPARAPAVARPGLRERNATPAGRARQVASQVTHHRRMPQCRRCGGHAELQPTCPHPLMPNDMGTKSPASPKRARPVLQASWIRIHSRGHTGRLRTRSMYQQEPAETTQSSQPARRRSAAEVPRSGSAGLAASSSSSRCSSVGANAKYAAIASK